MLISTFENCRLATDTRGLTTVEYVIVLGLSAVVAVGSWKTFGTNVKGYISNGANAIDSSMPAAAKGR